MDKNKKVLIMTGGGTGGHVMPNLALLPYLAPHFEIYYLGEQNSIEEHLTKDSPFIKEFVPIKAVKFVRKFTLKNALIPIKLIKNYSSTKKIIKKINPDIIFAKGGYVSLPVALAGAKLNVPILSHESDYSMGLANKIILKYCKVMFTSFRQTCLSNKCVFSGNPVRKEILNAQPEIAENYCRFATQKPTILFFGGSLGSTSINKFVFENLDNLTSYNIIHFVGKNNTKNVNLPNYCQIEFAENIYDFFAISEIVVCRSGANSIFELCALKKPMLLIPLPKSQSRGDQIENARVFKKNGFADILEEKDLNTENFLRKIKNLQKNKFFYIKNMKKVNPIRANEMITKYIIDYSK